MGVEAELMHRPYEPIRHVPILFKYLYAVNALHPWKPSNSVSICEVASSFSLDAALPSRPRMSNKRILL
jgi:hypothetical protein